MSGGWWPLQLAHPRWCPGDGGLCAYCRKPEPEHPKPERLCPEYDAAAYYRQMGSALMSPASGARRRRLAE